MLNKLLKTSFILVLAISLTACTAGSKKKTPGDTNSGDGSDGGNKETLKTLCEKYPESDFCKTYTDYEEMTPEEAKISARFNTNAGKGTPVEITYKDMGTWNSVVDIPVTKVNTSNDVSLAIVFTGNTALEKIRYTPRFYSFDTGKDLSPKTTGSFEKEGTTTVSAVMYMNYPAAQTGVNILVISFEKDGKKYFINLPNFTLTPKTN